MGIWQDFLGTTGAFFRLGFSGPRLKDVSGGLVVRNPGDTADAAVTGSKISASGDVIEINSDAASTGADWKLSFQRALTGMTANLLLIWPSSNGTNGQVLTNDGTGNLSWASAGNTSVCDKIDSTNLAFGSASPIAMFSTGAGDIIEAVKVVIDTAFNGTPTVSIGVSGTTSKYAASNAIDLTQPAGTVIELHPGLAAQGVEALIATYAAGGATAGVARILVHYGNPG